MTMFIFFTRTTPTWTILTNHFDPSFYIFVRHNLLYTKTTILKEKKLLINSEVVLTRDQLLEDVWGYDFDGETRTVDVHIRTLRQKLGQAGDKIETVRGVGYRIRT